MTIEAKALRYHDAIQASLSEGNTMSAFVPDFVITNKQGMFLARNPKVGRNQLPCRWVHDRAEAEHFAHWIEADDWRRMLPFGPVRNTAMIADQNGDIWTAERAQLANVYHSHKVQPVNHDRR